LHSNLKVIVDSYHASLQFGGDTVACALVLRKDAGNKAIPRIVGSLDCFINITKFKNRQNRAENLFLNNLHIISTISENSRLHKVTISLNTVATSDTLSTLIFT